MNKNLLKLIAVCGTAIATAIASASEYVSTLFLIVFSFVDYFLILIFLIVENFPYTFLPDTTL